MAALLIQVAQWIYDVYVMYRWLKKLVSGELSSNIKVYQNYRFGGALTCLGDLVAEWPHLSGD